MTNMTPLSHSNPIPISSESYSKTDATKGKSQDDENKTNARATLLFTEILASNPTIREAGVPSQVQSWKSKKNEIELIEANIGRLEEKFIKLKQENGNQAEISDLKELIELEKNKATILKQEIGAELGIVILRTTTEIVDLVDKEFLTETTGEIGSTVMDLNVALTLYLIFCAYEKKLSLDIKIESVKKQLENPNINSKPGLKTCLELKLKNLEVQQEGNRVAAVRALTQICGGAASIVLPAVGINTGISAASLGAGVLIGGSVLGLGLVGVGVSLLFGAAYLTYRNQHEITRGFTSLHIDIHESITMVRKGFAQEEVAQTAHRVALIQNDVAKHSKPIYSEIDRIIEGIQADISRRELDGEDPAIIEELKLTLVSLVDERAERSTIESKPIVEAMKKQLSLAPKLAAASNKLQQLEAKLRGLMDKRKKNEEDYVINKQINCFTSITLKESKEEIRSQLESLQKELNAMSEEDFQGLLNSLSEDIDIEAKVAAAMPNNAHRDRANRLPFLITLLSISIM